MTDTRWTRLPVAVWVIWLCVFCRLLFFISAVPLWEGFDEYSHVGYLQFLAENGRLPDGESSVSREVDASLRIAPVPYAQRLHDPAWLTEDAFWRLPAEARASRVAELRALPPAWGREKADHPQTIWEAQQPPLYYLLFAPLAKLWCSEWLVTRVWLLRLVCVLLASLAAPLTYWVAWEATLDRRLAVVAAALAAAFPEFVLMEARVSNECLAVVAGSLLAGSTLAWLRRPDSVRWAVAVGGSAVLALLTKAYFLAALTVIAAVAWRRWRAMVVMLGTPVLMSGWWYGRNWWLTGALSGQGDDVAVGRMPLWEKLQRVGQVEWLRAWDNIFTTHVWIGTWSFLTVRSWMYRVFAVVALAVAVGLVLRWRERPVRVLSAFFATLLLAVGYHIFVTFVNQGLSGSTGWYLYGFVAAEATLIVLALQRRRWPVVVPLLCLAALELFATHVYLLPYYAGLIAHLPNGHVPAFPVREWMTARATLWNHLSVNRAPFLTPEVMEGLWALYLGATILNAALGVRAALSRRGQPESLAPASLS